MATVSASRDHGPNQAAGEPRSVRPVIEHALTDYGYSLETARTLIDWLIAEARAE